MAVTLQTFLIAISGLLAPDDPPVSAELPAVAEPDWETWIDLDVAATGRMRDAWRVFVQAHRDRAPWDLESRTLDTEKARAAWERLESDRYAACAAGAASLRSARDDLERLILGTGLERLGGEKAEPFLVWALSRCASVDPWFYDTWQAAYRLAGKRDPRFLPAVFIVLRARAGATSGWLTAECGHRDTSPLFHERVFLALARYGAEVLPYLRPMLDHGDPYVRRNAAIALGFFDDVRAKPRLARMLEARDIGSGGAAFALAELGAVEELEAVAAVLTSPEPDARLWAARALCELGSTAALPALEKAIAVEKNVEGEMELAIDTLRLELKPFGTEAPKVSPVELERWLQELEAGRFTGFVVLDEIAASAEEKHLDRLQAIRFKSAEQRSMVPFHEWGKVVKAVRRRTR